MSETTKDRKTKDRTNRSQQLTRSNTSRLEIRIPEEDKKLIERAAKTSHATTTGFVLQAVRQAAQDVLRREQVTVVPPDFYEAMVASLNEPDEANTALSRAAARAQEIIRKA
ncbi:type II toxin-antitoxin system TacA family antitoxin [Streptomyces kebangsaanensis]|uniref:type II toxin-antitoxin system TacA family antitoxin n=1 Tax=Streptomyces kebangsaanensis TaxID=864058 RepID=UPI0009A133B9|nr:DUF1778 domain-containing protein [Streptomyces kebangsaanensis]